VVPQKTGTEIGNAIRARRAKEPYKMTQKELATAVNAPWQDIKLLESGEGIKNQGLLNRVARKLDISPRTGLPLPGKE
jgi:ribosome-binding protein aMBF1 (putative translation factor)